MKTRMRGSVLEVVEGSQIGGELVLLSQLADILAVHELKKKFEEDRAGVSLFKTIQKPSQGSDCV